MEGNAMESVYAVIMAGGQGTRLWPLSREERPKQFLILQKGGQKLFAGDIPAVCAPGRTPEQVLVLAVENQAEQVVNICLD
jgi:mannose-1-phosphate guanylyltransferase